MTEARKYTASPTAERLINSQQFINLALGPVGSGKSVASMVKLYKHACMQNPGPDGLRRSRWVLVRNTKEQLFQTTLKTWLDWFPDQVAGTWNKGDKTFYLVNGDVRAEFIFLPLDDQADVKKLLSLELSGGFINEAREIPFEIFQGLKSRMPRYPSRADGGVTHPVLLLDSNFPQYESWLWRMAEEGRPTEDSEAMKDLSVFIQPPAYLPGTWTPNPDAENLEFLDKKYYENVTSGASLEFMRTHVWNRYGLKGSGKPVYEGVFRKTSHVAKDRLLPVKARSVPLLVGMDFGRTPSAVFGQVNAKGKLCVYKTITSENMGIKRFLKEKFLPVMNSMFPRCSLIIIGDPAGKHKSEVGEESVFDIIEAEGYKIVAAPTNIPEKRIGAVEQWLTTMVDGEPALALSPGDDNKVLVDGFEYGYHYKEDRTGAANYDGSPVKDKFSHPHDAMQYLALGASLGLTGEEFRKAVVVEQVSLNPWM